MKQDNIQRSSSRRLWIIIAILIIGWLLLRAYAQSAVDAYNKCYWRAVSNTNAAENAVMNAGYSYSEAVNASFDTYADQVNICSKQRPPDWIILITNVTAKDDH